MMLPVCLGIDLRNSGQPVYVNVDGLSRHLHAVGATGAGKTVAIHALLRPLMMEPREKCCLFVIDPMGNLSFDLLRWMASRKCPEHVRRRLVYIEPARSEYVLPYNPLRFATDDNRYYHVARAVDLILRAWKAQDLAMQPRLMQWSYKALCAMAALAFPIGMSRYLLHPGTREHDAILDRMPGDIRHHWAEILGTKGSEATRILESTRNRFDPIYEAPQTRRMFGTNESRFDVERFIRERRIVIVNVAKLGRLPQLLGSTIGSLIANEVFETAFNMATLYGKRSVDPTYLLLDECQKLLSPDIEDALPTCRQMGLRLILAHQSFSQLEQGDIDLSNMIWQARNRLMFANSHDDADIVAAELAKLTFDKRQVKDMRTSLRQLIRGYRVVWLNSETATDSHGDSAVEQRSVGYNRGDGDTSNRDGDTVARARHTGQSHSQTTGKSHSDSHATSVSRGEHMVPIHDTIEEVSSVTYETFDEHRTDWEQIVRQLETGRAFGTFYDNRHLHEIQIDHDPVEITPRLEARVEELIACNFAQDLFISREEADRLAENERLRLLTPPRIQIPQFAEPEADVDAPAVPVSDPFRKRPRKSESS